MIGRALLLTASRQPYRRGGMAIGPKHAPARIEMGNHPELPALLAILRDPVISLSEEYAEDGGQTRIRKVPDTERKEAIAALEDALAAAKEASGSEAVTALLGQLLDEGDETELQPPSGATGNAEGDASASGAPGASGDASESEDASLTPPGTEPSSADGSAHSRQVADEPAADRKAGADEGKQPEETPVPPVAEPDDQPKTDKQNTAEATPAKPRGRAKATDATVK